jgi:hypothetical protein
MNLDGFAFIFITQRKCPNRSENKVITVHRVNFISIGEL